MKKFFFLTILITFLNNTLLNAEIKFVYVNMDTVVIQSEAGKNVVKKINKEIDIFNKKQKKNEKNLKDKETNLLSQKKLITEEEFKNKRTELRKEIATFKNQQKKFFNEINNKRKNEINKILDKINPILAKYANENSLDLILNKSSVILGKKEFDITNTILEIVNKEIK